MRSVAPRIHAHFFRANHLNNLLENMNELEMEWLISAICPHECQLFPFTFCCSTWCVLSIRVAWPYHVDVDAFRVHYKLKMCVHWHTTGNGCTFSVVTLHENKNHSRTHAEKLLATINFIPHYRSSITLCGTTRFSLRTVHPAISPTESWQLISILLPFRARRAARPLCASFHTACTV